MYPKYFLFMQFVKIEAYTHNFLRLKMKNTSIVNCAILLELPEVRPGVTPEENCGAVRVNMLIEPPSPGLQGSVISVISAKLCMNIVTFLVEILPATLKLLDQLMEFIRRLSGRRF